MKHHIHCSFAQLKVMTDDSRCWCPYPQGSSNFHAAGTVYCLHDCPLGQQPRHVTHTLGWLQVARAVIGLVVAGHFPLNHHPARASWEDLADAMSPAGSANPVVGRWVSAALTVLFVGSSVTTSLFVSAANSWGWAGVQALLCSRQVLEGHQHAAHAICFARLCHSC